jgi:hypothetical protein
MNQAPTIKEKELCPFFYENGGSENRQENGDRLLFMQERGLFLLVDSSHRKSSLSPLVGPKNAYTKNAA